MRKYRPITTRRQKMRNEIVETDSPTLTIDPAQVAKIVAVVVQKLQERGLNETSIGTDRNNWTG